MAPPSAAELVAAWLAERRGGSVLKDIWVKPLAALFDEDEWELGDIVTDLTDVTTLPGRRAMWAAILAECAFPPLLYSLSFVEGYRAVAH